MLAAGFVASVASFLAVFFFVAGFLGGSVSSTTIFLGGSGEAAACAIFKAALKRVISCGRTGAEMPAFIEGAGSAPACAQGVGEYPAPRTLTSDQIDTIIAYLQARIVGHGRITKAECLAYYDNREDMCEEFK